MADSTYKRPPKTPECPNVELRRFQKRTTERQKTPLVLVLVLVEHKGLFSGWVFLLPMLPVFNDLECCAR